MYQQIEQILWRYGYESISINAADIYLAFRQDREEGYAVVTLDETQGNYLSAEQFYHISEQIRDFLRGRGCRHCQFLYLLVSENDSSARRLFQHYECFWRIVPHKGQVMVFENTAEAFLVLRRPLEDLFEQTQQEQTAYPGYGKGQTAWQDTAQSQPFGAYDNHSGSRKERIKRLIREKRIPWCNALIILINVCVFFYTDFFGVFTGNDLLDVGALGWYEVLKQGEWYRLFTCMFLHNGIEHIFNNMLVLAFIGSSVELEIGSRRYGVLYIGSGILAGCTSMVYNMLRNDMVVSVGASGAIFGTVGAMLCLVLFQKGRRAGYSVRQIAWMAFLSLYGGFTSQGVDNAAHIGGFIGGFLIALLLTLRWDSVAKHDRQRF